MKKILFTLFVILGCVGCSTTQEGATVGGLSGAALGGIIGHQSGNGVQGAAIGGAVGVVGGMLVGERMEKKFCPVCGANYKESVVYCSKDGTELKYKEK